MKRVTLYLITLYAVLAIAAYFLVDMHAFYPPPTSYGDDENIIKLTTDDNARISAIYLPNQQAKYTILVSHGNAEDLGNIKPFLQKLHDEKFSVLAYDYQGYGTSENKPSEHRVYEDIQAAYNYLVNIQKVPADRIVLYGRSLGAAAAIDLAAQKPVAGLIIESAFLSGLRVVTQYPIFPFDRFDNIDKIKKVTAPVLVMHGKKDSVVPFAHAEKLYEAANCPKDFLWIDDAGHNDVGWKGRDAYWQKLQDISLMVSLIDQVKQQLKTLST
ncbi:MAG: Phospholipase/Carboxylesterase/putative lysophospholipase [Gammaproteobacteria bacterium]|nr:Phospholipase/Carboxylesterase/putative lysophospholipase [Gammaproteobacteria bacterium]